MLRVALVIEFVLDLPEDMTGYRILLALRVEREQPDLCVPQRHDIRSELPLELSGLRLPRYGAILTMSGTATAMAPRTHTRPKYRR